MEFLKIIVLITAVFLLDIRAEANMQKLDNNLDSSIKDTDTEIFEAYSEHSSPLNTQGILYMKNPAIHATTFKRNFSEASIGYRIKRESKPFLIQNGKGEDFGSFRAESHIRISEKHSVWGNAGYRRGVKKSVNWISSSDLEYVYPYFTADSIGGNLTSEEYVFGGGYGMNLKNWGWGIEGKIRARHEYRTVNPRPRNIVTDMEISAGAKIKTGRYFTGAYLSAQIYRQKSDVDFYGDLGAKGEYFMSGLGTHYARFKGNDNGSLFKGSSYEAGLCLVSSSYTSGPVASISYRYTEVEKILTEKNNLTIQKAIPHRSEAEIGWKGELARHYIWKITASASYELRKGLETITAENISNEYKSVGQTEMFRMKTTVALLSGIIGQDRGCNRWFIMPSLAWNMENSEYLYPSRNRHTEAFSAGAEFLYGKKIKEKAFTGFRTGCIYRAAGKCSLDVPETLMEKSMSEMIRNNFLTASSGLVEVSASIRTDIAATGALNVFVSAGYRYISSFAGHKSHQATVSCGVTF